MSEALTALADERESAEKNSATNEEFRFTPPPLLFAALSAARAAHDAVKAASLPPETIEYFDEGIDRVLDEIDVLQIEAMRAAGELDLARCKPATEVFAEIGYPRRSAEQMAQQTEIGNGNGS